MRIRVATTDRPRGWELSAPPGTTVAAIAAAAGLAPAPYYGLGGRAVAAACPLAETGAADGALLAPLVHAPVPAAVVLVALDGAQAGTVWPLPPGIHVVGRHPSMSVRLDDDSVDAQHAELCVGSDGSCSVRDRSSVSGTWLGPRRCTHAVVLDHGTEVRFGDVTIRVDDLTRAAPHPTGDGRHHRPPRRRQPPLPAAPVEPPPVAVPPPAATGRGLVGMLVPSLAGVGVAAVLRPALLPLAAIAPFGAALTWCVLRAYDTRLARRARHENALAQLGYQEASAAHDAAVIERAVARHPDLGEVACRVRARDDALWERRPAHDDFLCVAVGTSPTEGRSSTHRSTPVEIDVRHPVGIAGSPDWCRSVARALLVQLLVHHGPADLTVAVWTTSPRAWQWLRWPPHLDVFCAGAVDATSALPPQDRSGAAATLVVIDAPDLPGAWRSEWRTHLAGERTIATGIVLARGRGALPQETSIVIEQTTAAATVTAAGDDPQPLERIWTLTEDVAEDIAAALAPLIDADANGLGSSLPASVALLDLIHPHDLREDGTTQLDEAVAARWSASRIDNRLAAPIGVGKDGTFTLDLVADGPHGLIAGTTGSGKSELLRTIVMALSATVDAEHLAFVLVDYKGGSAFDGLSVLPHVVDVVTDLDAATAQRAIRGLEAEVHRRERTLRDLGVPDIASLPNGDQTDTRIPRLVIVVDEFATMAHDLPQFVDALVDVAQRGRSLGVHLLLATQRPSGAVKDAIRTNTNLRIALRVVDAADSRDVLGSDDAALIDRRAAGRALVRLGPGEQRELQAAYVSGVSPTRQLTNLRLVPLGASEPPAEEDNPARDLDLLTAAIGRAHHRAGLATPTRPWSSALPATVTMQDVIETARGSTDGSLAFGLLDDEPQQRHASFGWDQRAGNLLIAGIPGSGTTTALCSIAAATLRLPGPLRPHVYVIATSVPEFSRLLDHPSVGAVIGLDEDDRVRRLCRMLTSTIDARRRTADIDRRIVVLLDGIGPFRAAYDSIVGLEVIDALERIAADGQAVGVHLAFAADHPAAIGHRLERSVGTRVLLRLADCREYWAAGRQDVDPALLPAGGGHAFPGGRRVQLARLGDADIAAFAARAADDPSPVPAPPVAALPARVEIHELTPMCVERDRIIVELGIGEESLTPAGLVLHPHEHVLVTGPARSGRTTVLDVVAEQARRGGIDVVRIASPRRAGANVLTQRDTIHAALDGMRLHAHRTVLLVDDADHVDDAGAIERLVTAHDHAVTIFAAVRSDRLRGLFRHWTNDARRSGHGVLLRPDDNVADAFGVRLPRSAASPCLGRGWLLRDGALERCQFAHAGTLDAR